MSDGMAFTDLEEALFGADGTQVLRGTAASVHSDPGVRAKEKTVARSLGSVMPRAKE